MIVATTGALLRFTAVKLGIVPVPLAARPMEGKLLVQLYTIVPPVVGLLKLIGVDTAPLHSTTSVTGFTTAVGFTVIVKVVGVPTQLTPLVYVGVTVIVAVTGALPALVAVKLGILPVPLAARPIEGVLFVQLYTIVPPVVGLLNVTAAVGALLHTTWFATVFTVAKGFTVMVKLNGIPTQVVPPLV